jgi:hypothetical protein
MSSLRDQISGKTLEQVADFMANVTPGSPNDQTAKAELLLRQTQFQREASEAAKDTAEHTKRYTRYMLWSVIILAVSAAGSLIISILAYLK